MFKLTANPTFKSQVHISIPGQDKPGVIMVTFKHQSKEQLKAFYDGLRNSDDDDLTHLMKIISGWDGVDTPFSEEALDALLNQFPAAARELFAAYSAELLESKRKN